MVHFSEEALGVRGAGGSLPLAEDLVGEPTSMAAVSELGKRPSLCRSGNFWACCLGVLHPTRRTPLKSCRCPPYKHKRNSLALKAESPRGKFSFRHSWIQSSNGITGTQVFPFLGFVFYQIDFHLRLHMVARLLPALQDPILSFKSSWQERKILFWKPQ